MRTSDLVRCWDARWGDAEWREAVRAADEQAARARHDIDRALEEVVAVTLAYTEALRWTVSVRDMRARAATPMEKR